MAAGNSIDLDQDPRGIKDYGADKGMVQTMARLADYVVRHAA